MTASAPETVPKKESKEERKRREAEEKRREEYRRKQEEIEKLKRENMQVMYPELQAAAVQEDNDGEEGTEEGADGE